MQLGFWDIFFSLALIVALYIFIKSPVRKKYAVPNWLDPLFGFIIAVVVFIYFYVAHVSVNLVPESDYAACGRYSKQILCYNLNTETCMVGWHASSGSCQEKLNEIRKERPTALMGSFLETCIGKNFDKSMHYNRKNLSHPDCRTYFQKIDN